MDKSPSADEIWARIGRFQHLLGKNDIDGALMVQKMDVYYLAGTDQDAHLWVPAANDPLLMVRKSLERALKDSPLKQILPLNSLSQIPQYIKENGNGEPGRVGLEMDEWPAIGRGADTILESRMLLSLEPKYSFPGEGVVGIENTFVVTEQGMEKLNTFPDEIAIV
jgi:Xaa-Pro aminopeptidase